jgi:transcriptional regulator with XRE-family HTH domain
MRLWERKLSFVNRFGKIFMTIGNRLREERKRLGMSQPVFAEIASTTKQTLFSWESGKTAPDCFQLAAFASAGVDVLYVLTSIPLESHARLAVKRAAMAQAADQGGDFEAIRAAGATQDTTEDTIRQAQKADRDGFLTLAKLWPALSSTNRQALLALARSASAIPTEEPSAARKSDTRINVSSKRGHAAGRDIKINTIKDNDDKTKNLKPARSRGRT